MGPVARRRARAGAAACRAHLLHHRVAQPTQDEPSLQELGAALAVLVLHPGVAGQSHTAPRPPAGCAVNKNLELGQCKRRATRYTASDQCHPRRSTNQPPHRQNKGARPARLARARSLAHPIARACVAASRPPIPAPLAARSPTRNARRGRSPQSLSVGEPRHAWRVGLCVVHRGGASRPAGQNGGQPRSGVPSRGSGWLARTDQVLLARLAVGHAEVRSWVRYDAPRTLGT